MDRASAEPMAADTQRLVNEHFRDGAAFWTDVYESGDVVGLLVQRRQDLALAWMDDLHVPVRSRVLEVGCGAGMMTVELAKRGFEVDARDTVPEMIELTRRRAEQANVSDRVHPALSDIHALDVDAETFDAVIAIGVIPWLHSPGTAVQEMARILKPHGHVILTANNGRRLIYLIDPRYNPVLRPLRQAVKRILVGLGVRFNDGGAPARTHTLRELDVLLSGAGLQRIVEFTVGFGPVTLFGRRLMPAPLERALHQWLQRRAERGVPGIRSLGAQYVVLARKGATEPLRT